MQRIQDKSNQRKFSELIGTSVRQINVKPLRVTTKSGKKFYLKLDNFKLRAITKAITKTGKRQ